MKTFILILTALISFNTFAENNDRLVVGNFSSNNIENWEQKSFVGNTEYSLKEHGEKTVLQANSKQSASAFFKKIKVDLTKTPYLNWSWKKFNTLNPGDENSKQGDDFVARIYVVKDGGLFIWKTKALNYVWSYSHNKGETWDNPFVGNKARMVSVRDRQHTENQWFTEKRNIVEDFKKEFSIDITEIDGVAIMTDTDNSEGEASAMYGDIYFSSE